MGADGRLLIPGAEDRDIVGEDRERRASADRLAALPSDIRLTVERTPDAA